MKYIHKISLLISALIFIPNTLLAATYYVDDSAAGGGNGTVSAPFNNIEQGIGAMSASGGDILIIRDGIYNKSNDDMTSFVSGTVGNYNIIKAENDGGAVVTRDFAITGNAHHIQIEGLKFVSNLSKKIDGAHHIKIMRCAFEGGPLDNNSYTFAMGSRENTTEYILIEDSWFYGAGGRQNLLMYKSDYIVIRRVVLRHDHGWDNHIKADPEGVGTIYNSNNVEIQNVIVIDSVANTSNSGSEWVGGFTIVNNADSGGTCRDNNIRGTVIFNVEGNGFEHGGDGEVQNIQFSDSIIWWSETGTGHTGAGISMNNPGQKTVTATNITMGNLQMGVTLWGGNNSNITIDNSIIYGITGFPIGTPDSSDGTITQSYNNCYGNSSNNLCTSGIGATTFNPTINGLLYPLRIEDSTILTTSGQSGARVGAVVTNKIGISGTLYGDPGYNAITTDPLWPWPNENRIHVDFSGAIDLPSSSPANRGFAASSQTLTRYIWEALGNNIPGDVDSALILPTPQNIKVTKQ